MGVWGGMVTDLIWEGGSDWTTMSSNMAVRLRWIRTAPFNRGGWRFWGNRRRVLDFHQKEGNLIRNWAWTQIK